MTKDLSDYLSDHLRVIYPDHDIENLVDRLLKEFWPHGLSPRETPRETANALWDEAEVVMITYGDTFRDGETVPLQLLHDFLNVHVEDAINAVHILPFFPFSSDDGFAVVDYTEVNAMVGEWSHIEGIAGDVKLMSDLVLNHASSHCRWFDEFRQCKAPGKDYFVVADPSEDLSMVVRARPTELLKPVETTDGLKHVWCTFGHDQVDMNFANPDVLLEFVKILRLYVDKGIRIVRLDAVAFLWKERGTPCIHLPQTHEIIRLLRTLVNFADEDVVLITETNVPNHENLTYFGNQNEAHVIYNFSLPPLIVHALMSGRSDNLKAWMMSMPPAPEGCAYLNFIACHDGIGMRPSDGLIDEPARVEMVETVRKFGGEVSMRPGRKGNLRPYELNIALIDALKGTFEGPDEFQVDRFICAHTIMLSLEGIPAFYVHSLLATPNDYELMEKRKHYRSINRHAWDYPELKLQLADPESRQAVIFNELKRRLMIRIIQPAFHPNATQFTLQLGSELLGIWRQSRDRTQSIFAIFNLTNKAQELTLTSINLISGETWSDLLTDEVVEDLAGIKVLQPYEGVWLTNKPGTKEA